MSSIFSSNQLTLFDDIPSTLDAKAVSRSGSFVDNMKLPIHRWFRYSAGFSADWVRSVIFDKTDSKGSLLVIDPFAGVGTTLLACNAGQACCIGFEMHPFIFRVARTKLEGLTADLEKLRALFDRFYFSARESDPVLSKNQPSLLTKCYASETLAILTLFRELYLSEFQEDSTESRLLWLAITAILRSTSSVGTAQWQYILPGKRKANVRDPFDALQLRMKEMVDDIAFAQNNNWQANSEIHWADARQPEIKLKKLADLVITSPPYPNNYDYADSTRLEMTFWGEIERWGDLQSAVRSHLVRSCSQHAAAEGLELDSLLENRLLDPIHKELSAACYELSAVRMTKGGRKTYHTMAAAYFVDMAQVFISLRRLCRSGSELCFVIGDSAPYGVYLRVDSWLGELAVAAGFESCRFEKIRDRNTKWKNRKHRVPLKEGRLWIQG